MANVRKDFREAIEDYQRTIEDEKKSHELTKNVLEEAKMAASVFKADLEISNESVSQVRAYVNNYVTTL